MEPGEHPSQSPGRGGIFDAASLLGGSPFSSAMASPYAHLAHMPSAFSMLGRHPGFPPPPPFGGLGTLSEGLGSPLRSPPGSLGHSLSPTTGGAEWWRSASEHARRLADATTPAMTNLNASHLHSNLSPTYGSVGPPPPPAHLDCLSSIDSLYQQSSGAKSLNGLYSGSMFQLPNLSTTGSTTTSCSPSSQAKPSARSSSSEQKSPTKNSHRSSSSSSKDRERDSRSHESSSRSYESSSRSHDLNSRNAAAASPSSRSTSSSSSLLSPKSSKDDIDSNPSRTKEAISPYDPLGLASAMFPYPMGASSVAAASLFAAPPLFSFPFAPPFGMPPMFPPGLMPPFCHPPAPTSPTLSRHSPPPAASKGSSSHQSNSITKTTTVTTTKMSPSITNSSPLHSPKSNSVSKNRKKLFDEPALGLPQLPHSPESTPLPASLPANLSKHTTSDLPPVPKLKKISSASSPTKKSSPKKSGGSWDSDSELSSADSSLSDDSLASLSDSDEEGNGKSHKKKKEMPKLTPVMPTPSETSASSKRPPTPDMVQDLSMKKPNSSASSSSSSSSSSNSSKTESAKHKSSSSSTSSSKSHSTCNASEATAEEISMAYSLANAASKHQAELFAQMSSKYAPHMFMHPAAAAAAMMLPPGMFDGSLLMPPPPSSMSEPPSRRGGRGRGRGGGGGRGRVVNRGGKSNSTSSSSSLSGTTPTSGSIRSGRGGRGRGRGRGKSILQQEMERHQQDILRAQLEAQLKQQQLQLKLAKKAQEEQEATVKSHLVVNNDNKMTAANPSGAARTGINKIKQHESKLAQALMGQNIENMTEEDLQKALTSDSSDSDSESSDSDSGSDSNSESDSDMDGSQTSDSTQQRKRPADESPETSPKKRKRRTVIDETEVRIPIEHGWRRQVCIRNIGPRGLVGEVTYFTPCEKKLKSYSELTRYLHKNNITDLTKENFSFSTNINIGEFVEPSFEDDNPANMHVLSEQEVLERFMAVQARKKAKVIAKEQKMQRRLERKAQAEEMARRMNEAKQAKKVEQQEMARRVAELKLRRKMERQQAREAARRQKQMREIAKRQAKEAKRRAKQMRVIEMKEMKERERMMRQQEKIHRQEQLRMEKEMRAQQVIEEREMKRQQAVMMKEQERERRRQHMLLVKALEVRKKQEERERMKQEKINEKRRDLERKLEEKRREEERERELRRPVEDMLLKDHKDLPDIPRITGVRLAGEAFADLLMVVEFMHNFQEPLDLDDDQILTLQELQEAVLNEAEDTEEFIALVAHLLQFAVDDPGFNNTKESQTISGEKCTDIEITETNMSEILRIFIRARNGNKDDKMTECLKLRPLMAQTPTMKCSILAFLCNELLCSKAISGEVDKNIENISNMRRDKWVLEQKLRKLKMIQLKRMKKTALSKALGEGNEDSNSVAGGNKDCNNGKRGSDDEDEESGNESDVTNATGNASEDEEEKGLSQEELDKKVEKMQRQHDGFNSKVVNQSRKLRAVECGQDRFRRRYWVLPHCGGVFVEGMESCEPDACPEEELRLKEEEEEEVNEGDNDSEKSEPEDPVKMETNGEDTKMKLENGKIEAVEEEKVIVNGQHEMEEKKPKKEMEEKKPKKEMEEKKPKKEMEEVKQENGVMVNGKHEPAMNDISMKEEKLDVKNENDDKHSISYLVSKTKEDINIKKEEKLINGTHDSEHSAFKAPNSSALYLPKSDTPGKFMSELFGTYNKHVPSDVKTSSPNVFNNSFNSSLHFNSSHAETPSPFRSIESMIGSDSKNNSAPSSPYLGNSFLMSSMMSPTSTSSPMSAEQMLKNLSQSHQSECGWFSILPRMPCDETSITRCPNSTPSRPDSSAANSSPAPASPYHNSFTPMHGGRNTPGEASLSSLNNSAAFSSFMNPGTPQSGCGTPNPYVEAEIKPLNQFDKPKAVPLRKQRGWWRITEVAQLRKLTEVLHQRGIRERMLRRGFENHMDFACQMCGKGKKEATEIEETDESQEIEQSDLGVPEPHTEEDWFPDAANSTEQVLLDEVEALEDRVFNASLQGWKMPAKPQDDDDIELVARTASMEEVTLGPNQRCMLEVARERLLALEINIERRYLKPPFSKGIQVNLANLSGSGNTSGCQTPGSSGCQTGSSPGRSSPLMHEEEEEEEEATPALLRWRRAVTIAVSAAQITLCLVQLHNSIAWEKSIMKVSCQICTKDDNEAELLLCDSCDKGFHTYCFKPKMDNIPDGDWYCYDCIAKATGEHVCMLCGKKTGKMTECDKCPRHIHLDCLDPPMPRTPRRWRCNMCQGRGKGRKKIIKDSTPKVIKEKSDDSDVQMTPEKASKASKTEENHVKKSDPTDLTVCKWLLSELEKHDEAWPFLMPVNTKQFPSYKKIIKQPMDFQAMRNKLRDNVYKHRDEFAADVRLVFDNCRTFNEDDSEVGQAGHDMRKFFEMRWKEIIANS